MGSELSYRNRGRAHVNGFEVFPFSLPFPCSGARVLCFHPSYLVLRDAKRVLWGGEGDVVEFSLSAVSLTFFDKLSLPAVFY